MLKNLIIRKFPSLYAPVAGVPAGAGRVISSCTKAFSFSTASRQSENRRLEGKVAIVTGGASGIGEATCRLFVAHGAKVVIADIQDELGKRVTQELGPAADYIHCDVSKESDVAGAVEWAVSQHGCLDVMFNNAGIAGTEFGRLADLDMEEYEKVMEVNVRGVVHGVKHGARAMAGKGRGGSIVCTGSVNGVVAMGNNHAYTIAKHAVLGVVKTAALELGEEGIRVNSIAPWVVATPMTLQAIRRVMPDIAAHHLSELLHRHNPPLQGIHLHPDDIARAALFLASDDSRFISGHDLHVDGAFTSSRRLLLH